MPLAFIPFVLQCLRHSTESRMNSIMFSSFFSSPSFLRKELDEGKKTLMAIRNKTIPPYFESELGKAFLSKKVMELKTG